VSLYNFCKVFDRSDDMDAGVSADDRRVTGLVGKLLGGLDSGLRLHLKAEEGTASTYHCEVSNTGSTTWSQAAMTLKNRSDVIAPNDSLPWSLHPLCGLTWRERAIAAVDLAFCQASVPNEEAMQT
jgi:hypothetical protein